MQNEPPQPENEGLLNPVARHNARRYAVQAIYQWQVADTALTDLEFEFLRHHIDKKTDVDYFKELINGVSKSRPQLDAEIEPFLNRSLKDIDPVELAVLRIATYEVLNRPDVPYRVLINEALELTKQFGSVDGYKFVNGILDRIARKHRATEINIKK